MVSTSHLVVVFEVYPESSQEWLWHALTLSSGQQQSSVPIYIYICLLMTVNHSQHHNGTSIIISISTARYLRTVPQAPSLLGG